MNRSHFLRLASVMLVICLAVSCVVCGTLAKYTSTANGTDSATVAKWSFLVGDTEIAQSSVQTISFGLFDTINEADTETAEEHVTTGMIAPGTGGQLEFDVVNNSNVDAEYNLALELVNASNVPLEFSLDGDDWTSDLSAFNEEHEDVAIDKDGGEATITLYWRWVFEGENLPADDVADTTLGIAGQTSAPVVTVNATLIATQVD